MNYSNKLLIKIIFLKFCNEVNFVSLSRITMVSKVSNTSESELAWVVWKKALLPVWTFNFCARLYYKTHFISSQFIPLSHFTLSYGRF